MATVPIWHEQGVDLVVSGCRIVIGLLGLTLVQVRSLSDALRQITATPEWKSQLQQQYIEGYSDSEAAGWLLTLEARRLRELYTSLGLTNRQAEGGA